MSIVIILNHKFVQFFPHILRGLIFKKKIYNEKNTLHQLYAFDGRYEL